MSLAARIRSAMPAAGGAGVVMLVAWCEPAFADPPVSDSAALKHAIKELTAEAQTSLKNGRLRRARPDFARSFDGEIAPDVVGLRIVRSLHGDEFVDAYIRWQLTSFDPALPSMDDREYERFVRGLPGFQNNPRADESLIARFNRAVGAGQLSEPDQAALNQMINDMALQTSRVRALNQPATKLREWVLDQVGDTGAEPHLIRLEWCAALVEAGWDTSRLKQEIEETLEQTRRDRTFSGAQRSRFIALAERLANTSRLYVTSARVEEGTLAVQYATTAVYDFEVRRWDRLAN